MYQRYRISRTVNVFNVYKYDCLPKIHQFCLRRSCVLLTVSVVTPTEHTADKRFHTSVLISEPFIMLSRDQIQIALATPLPDDSVPTPQPTPTACHLLGSTPLTARQPIVISEFWTKEPLLWFAQTEAKFRRAHVTDSHVKYDHVLTHLNNDTLATILDLIEDVDDSTVDPYTILKERLLTTFSVTPRQRAHQLLHLPPLGDQRPSALMDKMLARLPSTEKPGLLFHEIFLEKMPQNIREHLATQQFTTPRQMARHADQLWDTRP